MRSSAGLGERVEDGLRDRLDLDHVVLDPEVVGDALGVAHHVRIVHLGGHRDPVEAVLAERFDREVGSQRRVDPAREPGTAPSDPASSTDRR